MKIAFTGSSSKLAGAVLPLLEADPDIERIVGLDVRPRNERIQKLHWINRDIRDPLIWRDMEGCDVLIHMAFIVLPINDTAAAYEINIEGSKNVFDAAAKAGVRKIVYTSSIAVYGAWPNNPDPISEETPRRGMPGMYYSWSKAKVEDYLDEFEKVQSEMVITRLRPPVILGQHISNSTVVAINAPFGIKLSKRSTRMQLVWDEDVAQAILLAIKKDVHGVFNLNGDGSLTSEDMAQMLGKRVVTLPIQLLYAVSWLTWKLKLITTVSPDWIRFFEYPIITDNNKAKTVMGWSPKYDTRGVYERAIELARKEQRRIKGGRRV